MTDSPLDHPFQPGVKVAIVRRYGWSRPGGTIERTEVASIIAKGRGKGRFMLVGKDGQYEVRGDAEPRRAYAVGYSEGVVYVDGPCVAEVEAKFALAEVRTKIEKLAREIDNRISERIREQSPEKQADILAWLEKVATAAEALGNGP